MGTGIGVDELLRSIYMVEVRIQAKIAADALKEIERLANHRFRGHMREQNERAFGLLSEIHLFLAAVGVISKILWPVRTGKARRKHAAELRTMLGVDDGSPLANRRVRDAMEHIDERIATWYDLNKGRKLSGLRIRASEEADEPDTSCLREVNQDTLKIRIYDAECDLRELNRAAQMCASHIGILAEGKGTFEGEPTILF